MFTELMSRRRTDAYLCHTWTSGAALLRFLIEVKDDSAEAAEIVETVDSVDRADAG